MILEVAVLKLLVNVVMLFVLEVTRPSIFVIEFVFDVILVSNPVILEVFEFTEVVKIVILFVLAVTLVSNPVML